MEINIGIRDVAPHDYSKQNLKVASRITQGEFSVPLLIANNFESKRERGSHRRSIRTAIRGHFHSEAVQRSEGVDTTDRSASLVMTPARSNGHRFSSQSCLKTTTRPGVLVCRRWEIFVQVNLTLSPFCFERCLIISAACFKTCMLGFWWPWCEITACALGTSAICNQKSSAEEESRSS